MFTPVALPLGRLRLSTSPTAIGSAAVVNTIGIAGVAALAADGPTRVWRGGLFFGYIADAQPEDVTVWFRAHDNGITFRVSEEDWQSVRALR